MDGVTGPELIQGGRPDERSPVAPSAVWRVAAAAATLLSLSACCGPGVRPRRVTPGLINRGREFVRCARSCLQVDIDG